MTTSVVLDDLPIEHNIRHRRGDYFEFAFQIVDLDLNTNMEVPRDLGVGTTGRFQVKQTESHSGALVVSMTFDDDNVASGWVRWEKAATDMALAPGTYYYDAEVTPADTKTRTWFAGTFTITPEVSAP